MVSLALIPWLCLFGAADIFEVAGDVGELSEFEANVRTDPVLRLLFPFGVLLLDAILVGHRLLLEETGFVE